MPTSRPDATEGRPRPRAPLRSTTTGGGLVVLHASTGLDDFEWGVTLFGVHADDLKDVVYTMRFDEASARYAEFGAFYTGMVASIEDVLAATVNR